MERNDDRYGRRRGSQGSDGAQQREQAVVSAPIKHGHLGLDIHPGQTVLGIDYREIGTVGEVEGSSFLIRQPGGGESFVPFSAVMSASEEQVVLNMTSRDFGIADEQRQPRDVAGDDDVAPASAS